MTSISATIVNFFDRKFQAFNAEPGIENRIEIADQIDRFARKYERVISEFMEPAELEYIEMCVKHVFKHTNRLNQAVEYNGKRRRERRENRR